MKSIKSVRYQSKLLGLMTLGILTNLGQARAEIASIAGTYGLLEVVSMKQHILPAPLPALGMTVTSHGFATIKETGEGLSITETFCDVALTPRFPVNVTMPAAYTKIVSIQGPLVASTTLDGKTLYTREEVPTVVGARLDDPASDALPTDIDDPRVFDEDNDGKPGITTFYSGILKGETYSVRRERYSFTLSPTDAGRLEGLMVDHSEEKILDATNPRLKMPVTVTADPNPNKSYIRLVPVSAKLSCDQLMAQKAKLFPKR